MQKAYIYIYLRMLIERCEFVNVLNFLRTFYSRLQRFDEWGLQFMLDILMRSRPEKEEDIYSSLVHSS